MPKISQAFLVAGATIIHRSSAVATKQVQRYYSAMQYTSRDAFLRSAWLGGLSIKSKTFGDLLSEEKMHRPHNCYSVLSLTRSDKRSKQCCTEGTKCVTWHHTRITHLFLVPLLVQFNRNLSNFWTAQSGKHASIQCNVIRVSFIFCGDGMPLKKGCRLQHSRFSHEQV